MAFFGLGPDQLNRPAETSAAEEDRTSRLEVDVTAMALLGEEQPVTTEVAAVTASAENGGDKPAARRSNSSQQVLHQQ